MCRRLRYFLFLTFVPFALAADSAAGAKAGDWFLFSLKPGQDPQGSPCRGEIDLSYLNESPAGKAGFVSVKGESFLDGQGKPLRLFGTNIVATALFPAKADAPRFAAHLASLGQNVVRCHFLDNQWGGDSLLQKPGYKTYNLEALDRFHFLAAELKKRGIYLNINLHVGRKYEGTPEYGQDFSKGLDLFYPPFTTAFQEYCQFLLTTKNPYTGLTPIQDAGVAVMELNNENTLLMNPWWLLDLKDPFRREILSRWNAWLKQKYSTDAALEQSYGRNEGKLGNELGVPFQKESKGGPWYRDRQEEAASSLTAMPDGTLRWEVKAPGPQSWSHQFSLTLGQKIKAGGHFQLKFKARADRERSLPTLFMLNEAPYSNAGLSDSVKATTEWKEFTSEFTAGEISRKQTRITISANNSPGWVELKDFSLREASSGHLTPGQSLAAGTVELPKRTATSGVKQDFFAFLAETEISWAKEQMAFLKGKLGVKVPVSHSQVSFGGMMGARRELMVSDFVDTHGYWEHPHFPNKSWDMKDWNIPNTSQLLSPDGGTLYEIAMQRPAGKPYTVSEYDIPSPNDFAAELYPMFAAVASQQNWAGLYSFCWANDVSAMAGGKIARFFDQCGNPAKEGFITAAALLYRLGLVEPLSKKAELTLTDKTLLEDISASNGDIWSSWRRVWKKQTAPAMLATDHLVSLNIASEFAADKYAEVPGNGAQQTKVAWQTTAEAPLYTLANPSVCLVTGNVSGKKVELGDVSITFGNLPGNGHATLMLVALDAQPLAKSQRVLLTTLRTAENTNMQWDKDRRSVSDHWGEPPTLVQGLSATLTVPSQLTKVYPLDASGKKRANQTNAISGSLKISPEQATIWWLLEK